MVVGEMGLVSDPSTDEGNSGHHLFFDSEQET